MYIFIYMRVYPTVYKSCTQPVILIWKEHFHELFWATTAMWWWSILKSSWCWVIHSFCTIYSAWVLAVLPEDSGKAGQHLCKFHAWCIQDKVLEPVQRRRHWMWLGMCGLRPRRQWIYFKCWYTHTHTHTHTHTLIHKCYILFILIYFYNFTSPKTTDSLKFTSL